MSVLLTTVGAGCSPTDDGGASVTLTAVCDARDLARGGDPEAARTAFLDRAHDDLHRLGADLADGPARAEVARMLERKQRVEALPRQDVPPEVAAARYADLAVALVALLRAQGQEVEGC